MLLEHGEDPKAIRSIHGRRHAASPLIAGQALITDRGSQPRRTAQLRMLRVKRRQQRCCARAWACMRWVGNTDSHRCTLHASEVKQSSSACC